MHVTTKTRNHGNATFDTPEKLNGKRKFLSLKVYFKFAQELPASLKYVDDLTETSQRQVEYWAYVMAQKYKPTIPEDKITLHETEDGINCLTYVFKILK